MLSRTLGQLTIFATMAFALAWPGAAAELSTAEEIDACYQDNFPETTAVQTISLNTTDRAGAVVTSRAKLYWRKFDDGRSKVLMRFELPLDMRGAGVLMVEKEKQNDLLMYVPALQRVKRVTKHMSSAPMFGTDFSYEEFEQIQGISEDAPKQRLADADVAGRPVYVLESKPTSEQESAYESIKTWIDKETCVALRLEFYESGGRLRKVMTVPFEKVVKDSGLWVPQELLMEDHRDETQTTLLVEELAIGVDVPRKIFSEKELLKGGH